MHLSSWVDEPRSQAEWDAWGYFLQSKSPPPRPPTPSPPTPPPTPSPAPTPPPPPTPCHIHIHHTVGCFNISDWKAGAVGPVLPSSQVSERLQVQKLNQIYEVTN
jgi:hypothetical protein